MRDWFAMGCGKKIDGFDYFMLKSLSGEAPHETLQSAKLQDYAESLQQLRQGFDNCR